MNNTDYIWVGLALFIIVDLLLLAWVIISRSKKKLTEKDRHWIIDQWGKIKNERSSKYQILEADKLLEQVMKKYGFKGSFGANLKKHHAFFSDINAIWAAHKLRNKIAHEISFEPKALVIKSALKNFEKALHDFRVL